MARKLESTELAAIGLNVLVPGSGHVIQGEATWGVLFFLAALAGGWCAPPVGWILIGLVATVHLYTVLAGKEDPKALPTVDFKSLPKKDEDEPEAKKPEPEPKKPEPEAKKPEPEAKKPEPEAKKPEPEPEADPEPEAEPEPEAAPEPEPEPASEPEAEDEPDSKAEEQGFERTESKSRIPAFKLSIPKPGEISEAEEDWPEIIPYLTKKLAAVQSAMGATQEFLEDRGKTWRTSSPDIPETTPTLLREIATELGGVEFEAMWSHGWPFEAGQTVSLFQMLAKDGAGWRFAHDKNDPSAMALLWLPTGEVACRTGTETTTVAEDIGAFIDDLAVGFRVASASVATQAVMEADGLMVVAADEVTQGSDSATFPDFWMGASGPGVKNVGWSFEHPYIRNPVGSRLADQTDCAIIDVFHEWLTTDAESPPGALDIAKMPNNTVRPVGKVLLDGEVVVAWWGESPPEEVDAFVSHMRDLTYAKS